MRISFAIGRPRTQCPWSLRPPNMSVTWWKRSITIQHLQQCWPRQHQQQQPHHRYRHRCRSITHKRRRHLIYDTPRSVYMVNRESPSLLPHTPLFLMCRKKLYLFIYLLLLWQLLFVNSGCSHCFSLFYVDLKQIYYQLTINSTYASVPAFARLRAGCRVTMVNWFC